MSDFHVYSSAEFIAEFFKRFYGSLEVLQALQKKEESSHIRSHWFVLSRFAELIGKQKQLNSDIAYMLIDPWNEFVTLLRDELKKDWKKVVQHPDGCGMVCETPF